MKSKKLKRSECCVIYTEEANRNQRRKNTFTSELSLKSIDRVMSIKESEWKLPTVDHRFLKNKKNGEQRRREDEEPWGYRKDEEP